MQRCLILAVLAVAIPCGCAEAQITVDYNAGAGLRDVVDSLGTPLPDGNVVEIGYFPSDFDISANAANLGVLEAAWHQLDSTTIRHLPPIGTPQPGRFADSATTTDPQFNNQRITLWIFKTSDNATPSAGFANVLDYGVFSSSAPNWVFPAQGTTPPGNATTITSSEVNQFYRGGSVAGGPGSLQLAAVPEPGAAALIASLGLGLIAIIRRWR